MLYNNVNVVILVEVLLFSWQHSASKEKKKSWNNDKVFTP